MTDAVSTTERSPREPFAGVPTRDLVRDVVAAAALLVGVALPWTASARGSDRIEVVLATVVALLAVALPYARRAGLVTAAWAADEQRTRIAGAVPLALVAAVHLLLDVVPGGSHGVGAGLGLGLAGAVLAAELAWPRTVLVVAGVLALGAVAAPVVNAIDGDLSTWRIVAVVLTAVLALGVLWLTAWRFERGDLAAGVLLVGVGIVAGLSAALLGANGAAPWVESVHGTWFGLVLLPVLAAAAVPRVVEQTAEAGAQPWMWAATGRHALALAARVGAYIALLALTRLLDTGASLSSVLRLVFGVLIALVAFFGHRALKRDVASGHATAVGAALVITALGLVLIIVRAGATARTNPVDVFLTFGLPAIVLSVLLVPRSLRELRSQVQEQAPSAVAPQAYQAPAAAATQTYQPPVYAPTPASGAPLAATNGAPAIRPEVAAAETTIMAPVEAEAGPPAAWSGPFGNAGATQVLPPVADVPGSKWSAAQALDPATPLADLALIVQESPHLRPLVAANPSTYPALLDWLGALGDPAVDAALRTRG
ncbi:hypothetical protein [Xylanimonas sp. McL0601]|uniref:DUF7937 domain-containing protein n=1 Tax=Xylanimonas sp. McL0601 TaxID=3414739 RepID=UPI003CF96C62